MAITFVGGKTFSHNGQISTSPQSVPLADLKDETGSDAVLQEGDVVFVWVVCSDVSDRTAASLACTDPSANAYDALHTDLYANDNYDVNALLQARQMEATPDTSVTMPAIANIQRGLAVAIVALRGVDYANLASVAAVTNTGTDGGVPNAGSITPVEPGSWVMACGGYADNWNFTSLAALALPAGMSEVANHFQSALEASRNYWENGCGAAIALKTDWAEGAYDPPPFGGGSTSSSASRAAVTLAIPPLASSGGTIAGTASITQADDTLAASGRARISGTASANETGDALGSIGRAINAGAASAVEAGDTLAAASSSTISGAASASEADEVLVSAGRSTIGGGAAIAEAGDGAAAGASLPIRAEGTIAETGDTLTASSEHGEAGASAIITEASEALSATARLRLAGMADLAQTGDVSSGSAELAITGMFAGAEAGDAAWSTPRSVLVSAPGRILHFAAARRASRTARFGTSRLAGRTLSHQE